MKQNRSNQRKKIEDEKRQLKGENSSPNIIVIVPLQEDLDAHQIVELLVKADENAEVKSSDGATHIK